MAIDLKNTRILVSNDDGVEADEKCSVVAARIDARLEPVEHRHRHQSLAENRGNRHVRRSTGESVCDSQSIGICHLPVFDRFSRLKL